MGAGPVLGEYLGTRIYLDRTTDLQVGDSFAYGLRGAFDIDRSFSLEGSFSWTRGHVIARDPMTGDSIAPSARIDVTSYDLDALYRFGGGSIAVTSGWGLER